ncbi:MAG: hypothetical protein LUE29_12495 [Lachnospiraceae bacterium]|nr:hypothetical protein [Lachnospiraceae bacterium]
MLPLIIGIGAGLAGLIGAGTAISGAGKMIEANDTQKSAQKLQEEQVERFKERDKATTRLMDALGKQELEIIESFGRFSDVIEKIQGRPEFKSISKDDVKLPDYEADKLREVSVGARALLGGLGGAAAGTAGGFAAAGATTSAVMALGTASTGTAISTLSGAALTNAMLAALGGGAVAAGGGGIALGTAVLGGATLGVGLLVGGIIFNFTGSNLSDKADEAWRQANETKKEVDRIVKYLDELEGAARGFKDILSKAEFQYNLRLNKLDQIVNVYGKTYWESFTDTEKLTTEDLVLLVQLLYDMCQVKLVLKNPDEKGLNTVNNRAISSAENKAEKILSRVGRAA